MLNAALGQGCAVTLGCSPWPGPCRGDGHGDTRLCPAVRQGQHLVGLGGVGNSVSLNSPRPTAGTEGVINQKLLMSRCDISLPEGKLFPFVWEGEITFWVLLGMPGKRN